MAKPASGLDPQTLKDCPMPRFIRLSSRRLVAALALATTLALPALTIIGGQTPANAAVTAKSHVMVPMGNKWK